MATRAELATHRIIVQQITSKSDIEVYRVNESKLLKHEGFSDQTADSMLRERIHVQLGIIRESEVFLGLNTAMAAILFIEALRRKSKVLTVVGLAAGAGALYANTKREAHAEELDWLEKEENAVELFDDSRAS